MLPADKAAGPERKRRFVLEAKAASALNHPNIITIHDISCEDGMDFIMMEYMHVAKLTLCEAVKLIACDMAIYLSPSPTERLS
jgi:hypothetical protein